MRLQETPKTGISSIVYDLTKWDYRVNNSTLHGLDITVTRNGEEVADVSFSDEEIKIFRKRKLSPLEEQELHLFLDDLMWLDEFEPFAHLSTIQSEYHNADELVRMLKEKYKNDLLYVRFNGNEEFTGFLEDASLEGQNGRHTLICYFTPADAEEDADLIRITIVLKPDIKAIATAGAVKVEGAEETLEIARHVQHEPV
ncbi:hypothetical protein BSNK01_07520 [Bacillaceae bacterium]